MRATLFFVLALLAGLPAIAAAQAAPAPAAPSSRWPMVADSPVGQFTIYKPQLEDFQGDQLTGRAAASLLRPGTTDPVFGAIWITSRVSIDRVAQTAQVVDVQITKARFPDLQPADQQALTDAMRQRMLQDPPVLSLSHLLASLEVVKKENAAGDALQTAPPKIVYLEHPAVKVQYDGVPRFVQQDGSPELLAVNTPFFVALDPPTKQYYLHGAGQWFAAPDALGPFAIVNQVPGPVTDLSAKIETPPAPANADPNAPAAAPESADQAAADKLTPDQLAAVQIITATEPTELIWTDGPAQMSSVQGTGLLYVANTSSDLFLDIDDQQLYVLLSGRWYSAPNHNGPWTFVAPEKLPPDFAKIPSDSDRSAVLAQVPGTPQAEDAVMDTYIPQTASIDRTQVQRPAVEYDGNPQFQPIEQTGMAYAVNSPYSVVWANKNYYCCWNGVWYASAAAVGPWDVCVSVPGVIYTMPPSCPLYSCRYVRIYGYTPQVVYCGYTPGYVGSYVYRGCVVYGTGYAYRPWIGQVRYYPRPYTFGFAAQYDPYSNFWGFGFTIGRANQWVRPQPRVVIGGGGWFGYGGYRPIYDRPGRVTINNTVINNVTIVRNQNIIEHNVYSRRTDVRAVAGPRPQGRPVPGPGAPGRGNPGRADVMSDNQGNVYRRTMDGWERRQGGQWVSPGDTGRGKPAPDDRTGKPAPDNNPGRPTARPAPAPAPGDRPADSGKPARNNGGGKNSGGDNADDMRALNRDYRARVDGEQREATRQRQQQQQDNSSRDPAPARPSRGNSGGGGGGNNGGGGRGGNGGGNNNNGGNGNGNQNGGNGGGGKNR